MNKMFREANKIWPAKSGIRILIIFFLIVILIMISSSLLDKRMMKKDFYSFSLNGRIEKCVESKNYIFYKINGTWFGVQGMLNAQIKVCDSIIKSAGIYDLVVISDNGERKKYQYPTTFFKTIEGSRNLMKYFKINVDTLDVSVCHIVNNENHD